RGEIASEVPQQAVDVVEFLLRPAGLGGAAAQFLENGPRPRHFRGPGQADIAVNSAIGARGAAERILAALAVLARLPGFLRKGLGEPARRVFEVLERV